MHIYSVMIKYYLQELKVSVHLFAYNSESRDYVGSAN